MKSKRLNQLCARRQAPSALKGAVPGTIASLLVTLGVAWLAVGSQAYRAARVSPADVLRHE